MMCHCQVSRVWNGEQLKGCCWFWEHLAGRHRRLRAVTRLLWSMPARLRTIELIGSGTLIVRYFWFCPSARMLWSAADLAFSIFSRAVPSVPSLSFLSYAKMSIQTEARVTWGCALLEFLRSIWCLLSLLSQLPLVTEQAAKGPSNQPIWFGPGTYPLFARQQWTRKSCKVLGLKSRDQLRVPSHDLSWQCNTD